MEIIENCQVEWDQVRGVLYVNNKATGATIVRVNGLPTTVTTFRSDLLATEFMDITIAKASMPTVTHFEIKEIINENK